MNKPMARRALKWLGITACSLAALVSMMILGAVLSRMADSYKASIVRDTIAAMKESNNGK